MYPHDFQVLIHLKPMNIGWYVTSSRNNMSEAHFSRFLRTDGPAMDHEWHTVSKEGIQLIKKAEKHAKLEKNHTVQEYSTAVHLHKSPGFS